MKKILIIMLLSSIESASAISYLTGFYVKGGLGATIAQFDVTESFTAGDIVAQPVDHQIQGTQMAGVMGIGYAYQLDPLWVLGGEFSMGFTSANASFRDDQNISPFLGVPGSSIDIDSNTELTLTNDFALIIKPGLAIQQRTQFYALLGVRWGNFENKTSSSSEITFASSDFSDGSSSETHSNYVLGFTVGVGVERMLTPQWGLGLEYAYTSYGNIPSNKLSYTTEGTFTETVTTDVSATATASTLILNASYRF